MTKTHLRALAVAALATAVMAVATARAAAQLFSDPFSEYPDGVITSEYQHFGGTCPCSTIWDMTSGTFYASSGHGWTGTPNTTNHSNVFRVTTVQKNFGDAAVSFRLLNKGLVSTSNTPAQSYDGVNVWLRYQSEYGPLYALSVNRRDNTVAIKKKVPGGASNGGTYYTLGTGSFSVPYNSWQNVQASAQNNPDGSVTLKIYANGALLASAVDNGSQGGAAFRSAGQVGIRGDNDNFMLDSFQVTSLSAAPAISGVAASGLTQTAANVGWTTDKASYSQVEYGPTASYGTLTAQATSAVTSHAVALSGLASGATYHYRVKSYDPATALTGVSGDFTFTTPSAAAAPAISGVYTSGVTQTAAGVYWTTDKASHSQVEYGPTTAYGTLSYRSTATGTSHYIPLSGLLAGTLYHYRVRSLDDTTGLTGVSGDFIFTTQAAATAPAIGGVSVSGVTNAAATVSWTTDKASYSQVEYGVSTSYGTLSAQSTTASASHAVSLSGLAAGTTYHFRVRSYDPATGLTGVSGDSTFATTQTLTDVISNVQASGISNTAATITWSTTLVSHSQVQYGPTTAYGAASYQSTATGVYHSIPLSSLKKGTVYHYRVLSLDAYGNTAVSGDYTFKTA